MGRPLLHPRAAIVAALLDSRGNVMAAAATLGMSRQGLQKRITADATLGRVVDRARSRKVAAAVCAACGGSGVAG